MEGGIGALPAGPGGFTDRQWSNMAWGAGHHGEGIWQRASSFGEPDGYKVIVSDIPEEWGLDAAHRYMC